MENEIPKSIYNIGKLAYPRTILTGKNYQVKKITKEIVDKNKNARQILIHGDFIITIGKKNVILTRFFLASMFFLLYNQPDKLQLQLLKTIFLLRSLEILSRVF